MRSTVALCCKSFVDRQAHWSNCKVHLHDIATTTLSATTNCKYPSTHASWRLAIEWHSRVDGCEQWQREGKDKSVSLPLPSSSSPSSVVVATRTDWRSRLSPRRPNPITRAACAATCLSHYALVRWSYYWATASDNVAGNANQASKALRRKDRSVGGQSCSTSSFCCVCHRVIEQPDEALPSMHSNCCTCPWLFARAATCSYSVRKPSSHHIISS